MAEFNLKDIREEFEARAADVGSDISRFIFSDLGTDINKSRKKEDYPLVLLKPPTSVFSDFLRSPFEKYNIEFFVFDTYFDDVAETKPLDEIWSETELLGTRMLRRVFKNQELWNIVDDNVNLERGHMEHNDKLVGVRFTFILQLFANCDE